MEFKVTSKDKRDIPVVRTTSKDEEKILGPFPPNKPTSLVLPFDANTSSIQLKIYDSSTEPPKELTIYYKKKPVLISHQCGCTYKYTLENVVSSSSVKCKMINKELSVFNDSSIDVQVRM